MSIKHWTALEHAVGHPVPVAQGGSSTFPAPHRKAQQLPSRQQRDPGQPKLLDSKEVRLPPLTTNASEAVAFSTLIRRSRPTPVKAPGVVEAFFGLATLASHFQRLGAVVLGGIEIQEDIRNPFQRKFPQARVSADFLDPMGLASWTEASFVNNVRIFTGYPPNTHAL